MDRKKAYKILTKYLHNPNLLKHSFAAEAAMKSIYKYLTLQKDYSQNEEEKWGIVGLLHDADYEIAQKENRLEKHGLILFELEKDTIPFDVVYAIKSHNFHNTNILPKSLMDWAITCVDQLTGLIIAAALIHPEKRLSALTPEFILNRFEEKSFAKGVDRKTIKLCEEKLGIPLKIFIAITLSAMQSIHNTLEL